MSEGKNIVVLWDSEIKEDGRKPFKQDHFNTTYSFFSQLIAERGGSFFVGNYSRYRDGEMEKAYRYEGGWQEKENVEVDIVFDKFKYDKETIPLKKEMDSEHPVVNRFELEKLTKNKLLTSERFPERHPETGKATEQNVERMLEEHGRVVLKPVNDYGGKGVEIIDGMSEFEEKEDYLVQRFVDSEKGIEKLGVEGVHDLRVVVVDGEPVLSYVRQPDSGYVSNVHQGGSMEFVDLEDVPGEAMDIVEEINDSFSEYQPAVFGVDIVFDSDQRPWILEINSKPGMTFYQDEEIKKRKEQYMRRTADVLCRLDPNN